MPVFVGAGQSSFMKGDGGVGVSTLTTTQRNALRDAHNQGSTLLTGSMFYDTSLNKLCVYDNGGWKGVTLGSL